MARKKKSFVSKKLKEQNKKNRTGEIIPEITEKDLTVVLNGYVLHQVLWWA